MNVPSSTHRADFDRIFATLLPGAREALEAAHAASSASRFLPLGASLGLDDALHGAVSASGEPPPAMVERMRADFRRQAEEGRIKACGISYDAQFDKQGVSVDAIATWLEHREGESVVIYVPYRWLEDKVQYGLLIATDAERYIWR